MYNQNIFNIYKVEIISCILDSTLVPRFMIELFGQITLSIVYLSCQRPLCKKASKHTHYRRVREREREVLDPWKESKRGHSMSVLLDQLRPRKKAIMACKSYYVYCHNNKTRSRTCFRSKIVTQALVVRLAKVVYYKSTRCMDGPWILIQLFFQVKVFVKELSEY